MFLRAAIAFCNRSITLGGTLSGAADSPPPPEAAGVDAGAAVRDGVASAGAA
jgi:hypothetical protein